MVSSVALLRAQAPAACLALAAIAAWAQGAEGQRECYRPVAPDRSYYEIRGDYVEALEDYFAQGSFYIACLDSWIEAARVEHLRQFEDEAASYRTERQAVLSDLARLASQPMDTGSP